MTILKVQGPIRGTATGSATSISVTMNSTPINGNVLIAVIGTGKIGGPYITVTSIIENGVSWNKQVQKSYVWHENTEDWEDIEIWLGIVGSGASTSIVIQLSSSISGMGAIAYIGEYTGIDTSDPLDKTASDTGYTPFNGDPGQTCTGVTSVTSKADELWIGGIACGCMSIYYNQTDPTNGFSLTTSNYYTESVAYLEKIVSATGQAYTKTTISYADWVGCIATFKGKLSVSLNETLSVQDLLTRQVNFRRLFEETLSLIDSVMKEKRYIYVRKVVSILWKKFGVTIPELGKKKVSIKYRTTTS